VEDGGRLVVVGLDSAAVAVDTAAAVGFLAVVVRIISIIIVDQATAVRAAVIILVKAIFTKHGVGIAHAVVPPDTVPAAVTGGCKLLEAVFAQRLSVELNLTVYGQFLAAMVADKSLSHFIFLVL
jgi:hypothetical protein